VSLGLFTYDDQHDVLIDQNLRLSPKERLSRMLQSKEALESLQKAARPKKPVEK